MPLPHPLTIAFGLTGPPGCPPPRRGLGKMALRRCRVDEKPGDFLTDPAPLGTVVIQWPPGIR
jgi:hypothetical protein